MHTEHDFLILGAGVIGLTTALVLREEYPSSRITVVAKHFPGDRSIEYTSPWAGANWCSFANDNGLLEKYDEVTFRRFEQIVEKVGPQCGLGKMGMWCIYDDGREDAGIVTPETGKIWYEDLVGGIKTLDESVMPEGAVYGIDVKATFRINTQVYLQWLQAQALAKNITLIRRHYPSITSLFSDFPNTTALFNCSALGSLTLTDVKDTTMYPIRGQTVLIAEPKVPIDRMYIRSPKRLHAEATYIFPRPLGGGIILGGTRQEGDWNGEVVMEIAKDIMQRSYELCPQLGKPEEMQVISHNVGLRPSRRAGVRVELEKWNNGRPVIHNYGHSGAGYQSSWGTAERAVELFKQASARALSKL